MNDVYDQLTQLLNDSSLSKHDKKVWMETMVPLLIRSEAAFLVDYFNRDPEGVKLMTESLAKKYACVKSRDTQALTSLIDQERNMLFAEIH